MFTGLTEVLAPVIERTPSTLTIERPQGFTDVNVGSSISVSGACLTVSALDEASLHFAVVPETWKRTTLGTLRTGDTVNLERALPSLGRFEGHIVQGHVDGVGEVRGGNGTEGTEGAEGTEVVIAYPSALRGLIVEKGSIAVDGVSLTVTEVTSDVFSVALIPETLKKTALGSLREGSKVNLEADILGKYVRNMVQWGDAHILP